MNVYIKRGRFGEFVAKIFEIKQKEEQEKWEKDEDWKLWVMYTRLLPDKSFPDWKKGLQENQQAMARMQSSRDEDLTAADIHGIIGRLFPEE